MKGTVTAREIAAAKGVTRQAVVATLDRKGISFVWKKGPSGPEKHYPITLLPEDYRVAVMGASIYSLMERYCSRVSLAYTSGSTPLVTVMQRM